MKGGVQTLDLVVGFHYNDRDGVDQVAQGALTSFGPTSLTLLQNASERPR